MSRVAVISRRILFFIPFALAISLGCARLGFWQISRLHQRQARNALVLSRLDLPAVSARSMVGDTAIRFRRAMAEGRYDYAHELVYATRTHQGSPGINFLTPLRLGPGDTAILINRGWVYSPDGMTVDQSVWREDDSVRVEGFIEEFTHAEIPVSTRSNPRAVRRLDFDSIQARMPYPILRLILVDGTPPPADAADRVPVRVEPPPLDEGPHRAYAAQWFAFAIIGIAGTILVVARDRRRQHATPGGAEAEQSG